MVRSQCLLNENILICQTTKVLTYTRFQIKDDIMSFLNLHDILCGNSSLFISVRKFPISEMTQEYNNYNSKLTLNKQKESVINTARIFSSETGIDFGKQ